MSLFQTSVLNKYLKTLDDDKVKATYQKFVSFFHNATIIENIKEDKEEQFQYGFLQKLFDEVLDYTINPNPDFNITTEFKNLKGSKKADGAILKDGKAIGVIELKSTKTKELSKITDQAFGYKNNHPTCNYIITSNFEKLRFYINDAVEHIDFDLFSLSESNFRLLYLCLQKDNLLSGLPLKIKNESTVKEEDITKQLYKDYSAFKKTLFNDMVLNNPTIDKMLLFEKSQKLLDRFLFILFAEDKGLLPPNSISEIIQRYETLKAEDFENPLYDIFKQYFGYIDKGRPAKGKKAEIFAFNGGLFKSDEILDNVVISNSALMDHAKTLTAYDFESEVDVNILGHIFEHSLNDIDQMAAEISGEVLEKGKTKRKKDGVFYTPKYITKYIIDNTVGKLAKSKKDELGLLESEYIPKRTKAKKEKLLKLLDKYREYLLSLTICDPACGSGAFLNQALDFLINEHRYINELQAKLFDTPMVLSDISKDILERNIYGVDINNESVEIARLSLWLRTAQKGRALTSLSGNIKCGNSLISGNEIEKSFNWELEFPKIFAKGGFDIIIGNPPYVRQELLKPIKPYLENNYKTFHGSADLFVYFIEKGIQSLLKENGLFSIIVANKWMKSNYGKPLRNWIKQFKIIEIIDFGDLPVFKDATAYPCILTVANCKMEQDFQATNVKDLNFGDLNLIVDSSSFKVNQNLLLDSGWSLIDKNQQKLIAKLMGMGMTLSEYISKKMFVGLKTGFNIAFIIDEETKARIFNSNNSEIIKPYVVGRDISAYGTLKAKQYVIAIPNKFTTSKSQQSFINEDDAWDWFSKKFPKVANHLKPFEIKAKKRSDQGEFWWELRPCEYYSEFEKTKIIYSEIATKGRFAIEENKYYCDMTAFIIGSSEKKLLAILNSKLFTYLFKNTSAEIRGGFLRWKRQYLYPMPIPNLDNFDVANLIEEIISEIKTKDNLNEKFQRTMFRKFNLEKLSKKLQKWDLLTYEKFIQQLKKKKVELSLSEEAEWEEYFEIEKSKSIDLQMKIDSLYMQIDNSVYRLYGLNSNEIAIVETSII